MNCDECRIYISESLDARRPAVLVEAAGEHLSHCADCREFLESASILDAELTRHAAGVSLPADFKSSLLARLPAARERLIPAELAERRADLEREYRVAIAALNRRYLIPQALKLARWITMAAGVVAGAFLLARMIRELPSAVTTAGHQWTALTVQLAGWLFGLGTLLFGVRHVLLSALRGLRLPRLFR